MRHIMIAILILATAGPAMGLSDVFGDKIYDMGALKPTDSVLKVKPGDPAPEFTLPSISGNTVSLSDFRGQKNVIISFVPAAWTPVCSDQWPGYKIAAPLFDRYDAIVLGITVDNLPTLYAWVKQMGGLGFDVLSDFWPHGRTAAAYGVLRGNGLSERAIFIVDKNGIVGYAHVSDINQRPELGRIVDALSAIDQKQSQP